RGRWWRPPRPPVPLIRKLAPTSVPAGGCQALRLGVFALSSVGSFLSPSPDGSAPLGLTGTPGPTRSPDELLGPPTNASNSAVALRLISTNVPGRGLGSVS